MVPSSTPNKTKSQILPMPMPPQPSSLDGCTPSASLPTSSTKISTGLGGSITSDVIPIPKSSINDRNLSETSQLVSDLRRAKDDDVRMYARLVVGMREQIQRDYHANGGVVHPLLKKSLLGVLRTSQTRYDEIEDYDGGRGDEDEVNYTLVDAHHEVEDAKKCHLDGGPSSWKVSFIEDELEGDSSVDSPWSTPRNYLSSKFSSSDGTMSTGMSTRLSSTMSHDMTEEDHEDNIEDNFVFCLEL